jgi:uncharacterized membrane protein YccF (DUF307 family)
LGKVAKRDLAQCMQKHKPFGADGAVGSFLWLVFMNFWLFFAEIHKKITN